MEDLLRHITFRQLRVFATIARVGSFTAAAEQLHLTQPTVSVQMRRLTDAVGMPLFEHVGKRVFLTDVGRVLLEAINELFGTIGRFEMAIDNIQGVHQGNLRIAAVTTSEYFAPRILGAFRRRYPGIKLFLQVTNRENIIDRLSANEDDLYILSQPPGDMDIVVEPFLNNPMVVLAAPQHELAGRVGLPVSVLAQENFLLREQGSGTRMALNRFLALSNVQIVSHMELGSNEAIKQATIGGLGVCVLSRYAVVNELRSGEVVMLDITGFPLLEKWYVVRLAGKPLSVVAQAFLTFLLKEGKEMFAPLAKA